MKSFLIIIAFIINSANADCIVQEIKEESAKLFCINTTKTEYLKNSSDENFKVINYDNMPVIEVYTQEGSLSIGETLKNTSHINTSSSQALAPIEIPLESTPSIFEKINPFKSESLKIYVTGLQLSGTSMKAEFSDSTAKIENTSGEFNSLPLDLTIELDFGGSGLTLLPDFKDKTGQISAFAKLEKIDIGGYFSVNNVNENITIYDATIVYSDIEENSKEYEAGILVRNRSVFESGELHTIATLGYAYSGSDISNKKTGATSNIYFNAAKLTLDISYYKKVSKEFYIGGGLLVGTGMGHIEFNDGSNILADKVSIASIQLNFLKVMMVY